MISGKEEFYQLVDEGRQGHNIGLSTGSTKLDTYMDGVLPGTSYLIGGLSGVSKSTFTLWAFVYQPLIHYLAGECQERDPHWLLFSLEMTRPQVYAKLLSMYIFDNYGEEIRFKEIFSRGKDTILTDSHFELLKDCESFLDILDERLVFFEGSLTEDRYLKTMNQELKKYGKWEDNIFHPFNPHQFIGVIIDHVSLIKASSGKTKKDEMDAISRDSVMLRNVTKIISPIHVAQFNRSSSSDERLKQGMQDPSSADYKDTGAIYEDSQVVIALHSPHKFKLTSYKKYNIRELEQIFIAVFLLKSRFGTSDVAIPLAFYGDCSQYRELPKPSEITDYGIYKTPFWSLRNDNVVNDKTDRTQEDSKRKKSKFDYSL